MISYLFFINFFFYLLILFFISYKIIYDKFYIFSIINITILFQLLIHHFIPFYLNFFYKINFYESIRNTFSNDIVIIFLCSIVSLILLSYLFFLNKNKNYNIYNQNFLKEISINKFLSYLILSLGLLQFLIFSGILPFPFVPIDEWTKTFYKINYDYWPYYNPIHLGNINNYIIKNVFITLAYIVIPFSIILFCFKLSDKKKILIFLFFLIFLFILATNQRSEIIGFIFPPIAFLFLIKRLNLKDFLKLLLVLLIIYFISPLMRSYSTQNLSNSFIERSVITINSISNIICNNYRIIKSAENKICDIIPSKKANFIRSIEKGHDVKFEFYSSFDYTFSKRTDANLFSDLLNLWKSDPKKLPNTFNNFEYLILNLKYLLPNPLYDKSQSYKPINSQHEYFISDPSSYLLLTNNLPPNDFIRSLIIDINLLSGNFLIFIFLIILFFYLNQKLEIKVMNNYDISYVILFLVILQTIIIDFNITHLLVSIRNGLLLIVLFKLLNLIFNYFSSKIVRE